jgi:hypothetical protein
MSDIVMNYIKASNWTPHKEDIIVALKAERVEHARQTAKLEAKAQISFDGESRMLSVVADLTEQLEEATDIIKKLLGVNQVSDEEMVKAIEWAKKSPAMRNSVEK